MLSLFSSRWLLALSLSASVALLIGCGGGGGAGVAASNGGGGGGGGPAIPDAENGTARVDVDVETGRVVVTPLGSSNSRSMYTGSAVGISSSSLSVDEGELTVRKLRLTIQNNTADRIGSSGGARLVIDRIATDAPGDLLDLRAYTQVSTRAGLSGTANDGPALNVVMNRPYGIAADGADLLVAGRDEGRLRRLSNGFMSTVATGLLQPHGVDVATPGQSAIVVEGTGHRITRVELASGAKTVLAGSGSPGFANGTGAAAAFNTPRDVVVDGGTAYISDQANNAIRKAAGLAGSSAAVTTLKQDANLTPTGLGMYDHAGVKFLLVTCSIRHKIYGMDISTGEFWTIAGNNAPASVDGRGDVAQFNNPGDAAELNGAVYVTESSGQRVRQITLQEGQNPRLSTSWRVKEIAGAASAGYSDGTGLVARFYGPQFIAAAEPGELYITEFNINRTRRITPTSGVFPIGQNNGGAAGNVTISSPDGYIPNPVNTQGRKAYFSIPTIGQKPGSDSSVEKEIGFVLSQNIKSFYFIVSIVGESETPFGGLDAFLNQSEPFKGSPNVNVRTLAGSPDGETSLNFADGEGIVARFGALCNTAANEHAIYVADSQNAAIRRVSWNGKTSTIAGIRGESSDPIGGTGETCRFNTPYGIWASKDDTLIYVSDTLGHVIFRLSRSLGSDPNIAGNWVVSIIAGSSMASGMLDGRGDDARFNGPHGLDADASGDGIWIADRYNNRIRRISYTGGSRDSANSYAVNTVAGSGIAGFQDGEVLSAEFSWPNDVAWSSKGEIFVCDLLNRAVRRIDNQSGQMIVVTLAGTGQVGRVDGPGSTAQFENPWQITSDDAGYIYVSDQNFVRRISSSSYEVKTVAGTPNISYEVPHDGDGSSARARSIQGIDFIPSRGLVIGDARLIRVIERVIRNGN